MATMLQRIVQSVFSIVTTFVLMAAPIAAIIYFSEPAGQPQLGVKTDYTQTWKAAMNRDEQQTVIKETFVTEPILALVKRISD